MKQVRVRSITSGKPSPWVYIQEQTKEESKVTINKTRATQTLDKPRNNQYGRFRYSEMQYGTIERLIITSIDISKTPIRIRNLNGEWVYLQQMSFLGASPAVRIRQINTSETGPWVYIQNEEV